MIAVVGSGGDGVALLGDLILKMAAQQGLYGVMVQSYGPQIRGGESAVALRLACEEVHYEGDHTDLLLCFRLTTSSASGARCACTTRASCSSSSADPASLPEWLGPTDRAPYRYPFATFLDGTEVAGDPKNMLGLGAPRAARSAGPPELARQVLETALRQAARRRWPATSRRSTAHGPPGRAGPAAAPGPRRAAPRRNRQRGRRRAARSRPACGSSPAIRSRRPPRSWRR